jgi:hypothetical protein
MSQTAATQNPNSTSTGQRSDAFELDLENELALSLIRSESNNAGLQLLETSSKNAGADLLQNTQSAILRLQRDIDAANNEQMSIEITLDEESRRITKLHDAAQSAIMKRRMSARASFERQNNERSTQIRALNAAVSVLSPKPSAPVATDRTLPATPAPVRNVTLPAAPETINARTLVGAGGSLTATSVEGK